MVPVSMLAPRIVPVMLCGLISSPCKGEDEGEGPCTARYSARDSRFCLRILYPPACYLCVIPSGAEGLLGRSLRRRCIALVLTLAFRLWVFFAPRKLP